MLWTAGGGVGGSNQSMTTNSKEFVSASCREKRRKTQCNLGGGASDAAVASGAHGGGLDRAGRVVYQLHHTHTHESINRQTQHRTQTGAAAGCRATAASLFSTSCSSCTRIQAFRALTQYSEVTTCPHSRGHNAPCFFILLHLTHFVLIELPAARTYRH